MEVRNGWKTFQSNLLKDSGSEMENTKKCVEKEMNPGHALFHGCIVCSRKYLFQPTWTPASHYSLKQNTALLLVFLAITWKA